MMRYSLYSTSFVSRRYLLSTLAFTSLIRPAIAQLPAYRAELVPGEEEGGRFWVGFRIVLGEGWKTYWRMPGEAGIAPEFDWSQSRGVKEISVFYPAPRRFSGNDGDMVGYSEEVVLPIAVQPSDSAKQCDLKLAALFGVCQQLCIPARTNFSIELPTKPSPLLATWRARVPRHSNLLSAAKLMKIDAALSLSLVFPVSPRDVFIESETSAYFGKPIAGPTPGSVILPVLNVTDAASLRGKAIRVTAVFDKDATEQHIQIS